MSEVYWKVDKSMLSDTLVAAIELAGDILEWDTNKYIMINYYKEDAKVEDEFLEAFVNNPPTIRTAEKKTNAYGWFEKGDDRVNQFLFLNMKLVNLCREIKSGQPGYNRLIFFVAITIIQESSHWLFYHFKQEGEPSNLLTPSCTKPGIHNEPDYPDVEGVPEVGWNWEFKLFGEKSVTALRIKIGSRKAKIESPLAKELASAKIHLQSINHVKARNTQLMAKTEKVLTPMMRNNTRKARSTSVHHKEADVDSWEDLVDDEDNIYRFFKIDLDINLNDEFTDAEIAIKLTNESNQVAQLPKEFQPCLFFIRLENDFGSVPQLGSVTKPSPYIDDYELVSIPPGKSISYSFDLCSMYVVKPNVSHRFSVRLEASSHPADFPDNLDIQYVSKNITEMIMVMSPSLALKVDESQLNCPYPEFMENYSIYCPRGHDDIGKFFQSIHNV